MKKEEIFNYLDKKLGAKTQEVIAIKDYIQTREEILENIENYCEHNKEYTPRLIDILENMKEIK